MLIICGKPAVQKYIWTFINIDFRKPNDVEEVNKEAIVNSESKENEGGWWDSLYSAAKSKVCYLFLSYNWTIVIKYMLWIPLIWLIITHILVSWSVRVC